MQLHTLFEITAQSPSSSYVQVSWKLMNIDQLEILWQTNFVQCLQDHTFICIRFGKGNISKENQKLPMQQIKLLHSAGVIQENSKGPFCSAPVSSRYGVIASKFRCKSQKKKPCETNISANLTPSTDSICY